MGIYIYIMNIMDNLIKDSIVSGHKLTLTGVMCNVLLMEVTFNQLLGNSDAARADRSKNVNARSIRVRATDDGEAWTFTYKSRFPHSTTGKRFHGYVQFSKENVSYNESAQDLDCKVHCDCPDYFYRWEYNNAKAGAGDFCDAHNRQAPKSKDSIPPGVGNLGEGLCKHLIALGEFLETKIEPSAPEPGETPEPEPKTVEPAPEVTPETPTTTDAPRPEDGYSDTRSGNLQEGNRNQLYEKIDNFIRTNPVFDVPVYE